MDLMKALVFGQDVRDRKLLQEILQARNHAVVVTDDLEAAKEVYDRHRQEMLFLSGLDDAALSLARFVRRLDKELPVIVGLVSDQKAAAAAYAGEPVMDDTIVGRREPGALEMRVGLAERRAERRRRWFDLEARLRESEVRYRLLAEHATDMISRHAPDGKYLYASPACRTLLGYEPEELIGLSAYEFFHPDDVEDIRQSHDEILSRPDVKTVVYRIRRKNGSYVWCESTSRTVSNEVTGEIDSIIAVSRDISSRRQFMQAMRRCRRELTRTQRLAHIGTWYWSRETDDMRWTDEVFAILGAVREVFAPSFEKLLEVVHPGDLGVVSTWIEEMQTGSEAVNVEFRIVRPDGEERSIVARAEPEGVGAAVPDVVGIFQDVTEFVAAEEALEAREKQYQAILETTVDGIIAIDAQGSIRSFNRAAEEIFGFTASEVIGSNVKMLMPDYYAVEHDSYIRSYLETGHRKIIGIGREVVGRRKDGSTFPMDLAVSEVRVGGQRFFSGIIRDVSERRQLEQQILRISEQERQRIGQDLHDGLGQMLTGIGLIAKNMANRLQKKGLAESADMLEITNLIGEADEYARSLARGLIPVELDAGGLASAFHRLATNARKLFGIECVFEEIGEKPDVENVIATHLYRIGQEALSNAVRHGRASQVRIVLAHGEEQLRLRLSDNGHGMPESLDERHPGMGIRIMRYRARIIGATLEIRSRPEGGTLIICTLPIEAASQSRTRPNTGTDA